MDRAGEAIPKGSNPNSPGSSGANTQGYPIRLPAPRKAVQIRFPMFDSLPARCLDTSRVKARGLFPRYTLYQGPYENAQPYCAETGYSFWQ